MKKITSLILILLSFLILAPLTAKADGGMFYPYNYPIYENGQKAFIYFHEGTEDLVVQPSYEGSAKDFVWVMPTPTQPEVNKASKSIFTILQRLTIPDTTSKMPTSTFGIPDLASTSEEVQIIDQKTIDAFDLVTLKATSATALSEWLKTNNYSFPEDKNYLLADYVNQGWYFVIAKIRPDAAENAQSELKAGTITPIRFTFKSAKIIYPMKLTKVAMEQPTTENQSSDSAPLDASISNSNSRKRGTNLTLYVLSNNRVDNSELSIIWANWLKTADIKKILSESPETNWIQSDNKLFLTKMSKNIYAEQIKDDLVMANYENNAVYPTPFYKEGSYWSSIVVSFIVAAIVLFLSPLLWLFIIFSLVEKYNQKWSSKSKWFKIALLSLFLVIGIIILVASWINVGSFMNLIEEGGFVGAVLAFITLETILIVLTLKKFICQKPLGAEKK